MTTPLLVKVSRDGKEIGQYSVHEAVRLLADGSLRTTDHYWHDGMTSWGLLSELKARRKFAKDEEDRVVAEAVRIRVEKEKANWFCCHCCRESFPKPIGAHDEQDGVQAFGVIILLVAIIAGLSTGLGIVGALLFGLAGLAMYWGPEIRSRLPSLCPNCRSTNFSRPEKTDEKEVR